MDFDSFVEGPLFWIVSLIFLAGLVVRIIYFSLAVAKSGNKKNAGETSLGTMFAFSLLPFHRAVLKRPIYAALRFIFHICLIVVPIWLAGHIAFWEESRFGWSWASLPDAWADWMTLLLLALAAYFLIRRIASSEVRLNSSASDYVLIIIAALPFLTGYLLTHGSLDSIPFLGNNMRVIHVLSAEVMLIAAVFLFCRTRLAKDRCTGCAACAANCLTGTLEAIDRGKTRFFSYSLFQCICCGACVNACPEKAAELRHEFGLQAFYGPFVREEVQTVGLAICNGCGALFAPGLLLEKVERVFSDDYRRFCSSCKKKRLASDFNELAPWPENQQERLTGT